MIRPRNVDLNKRLLVSTDQDELCFDLHIPHCAFIEVPKIEEISDKRHCKKLYTLPSYYQKYSSLPSDQLENLLGYEASEDDLQWLSSTPLPKSLYTLVPSSFLETTILIWENDTNKGQIIPLERAIYLLKEAKIIEDNEPEDTTGYISKLYQYWIDQRKLLGRSLVRKYWKSEGNSDQQVKTAFQPRTGYRERMRLRNSRKNDSETLEKVRAR